MADNRVRVLVIAPYESLKTAAEQAAENFPSLKVDVYTGDLKEGAALFSRLENNSYDAVISRGGTASMIRSQADLPVVDIRISAYDMLKTMHMADNYTDRYAVVGFPDFTEVAHTLCAILRLAPEIITIKSGEDAVSTLNSLSGRGCDTVLCDSVTHTEARRLGMNAFLITSGVESLNDALSRAAELGGIYRRLRSENGLLRALADRENDCCAVLDRDGRLCFSLPDEPEKDLLALLRSHLPELGRASGEMRFFHNRRGTLYAVTGKRALFENEEAFLFHYQPTQIPIRSGRPGIRSIGLTECEHLFSNSFFSVSGSMGALDGRITALARSRQGIMIIGETGTGKHQVAHALYLRGPLTRNPFIVIDCSQADDRAWNYLLSHENSPLNSSDITLCFHHAELLPETRGAELLSVIKDTALVRRERVIFSCECKDEEVIPTTVNRLISGLGLIPLRLPTLRSRSDEISSLAALYLGSVNTELGTQLAGFEPGAIKQLEHYGWPGNYTEFKQVIHELASLADTAYIRTESAAETLSVQQSLTRRPTVPAVPADMSGTLEEITRRAVEHALHDNHGNQSAAARQLGIGRTTMWRYLGKPKE